MLPATLAAVGPAWAAPGETAELRLEAPALHAVAGRVCSRAGTPLAGVRIALGRALKWQRPERDPDPWAGCTFRTGGPAQAFRDLAVATDDEGRFHFAAVHLAGSYLAFEGADVFMAQPFQLAPEADNERLEITLPVRSTFRIVLDRPGEADAFKIRTLDDQHATVLVRVEGFEMSMGRIELAEGRSPDINAEAREVMVVLLRGESDGAVARRQRARGAPLIRSLRSGDDDESPLRGRTTRRVRQGPAPRSRSRTDAIKDPASIVAPASA
jgi:hypothetical protein